MKILVISEFGNAEIKESEIVPRVGDKVDMFYDPSPTVNSVLLWPTKKRLKDLNVVDMDIHAIVTVS